jgi:thiol-disulfide isomerase/thioredoxin
MADNEEIKLEFFNTSGELIKYSSKVIKNHFEINGTLEDSSSFIVKLYGNVTSKDDSDPNATNFFIEPGNLFIKLESGDFKNALIEGSEDELIHKEYLKILAAENSNNHLDSLSRFNARLNFIKTYPNSSVSAFLVLNEISTERSLEHIKMLFNSLDDDAKKCRYALTVSKKINSIEKYSFGLKLDSFKGIDTTENEVEITNFSPDITIIDFWATWCKPCIENFAVLKEIQKSYPDKNIKIITISTDYDYNKWKVALYKYKIEHWINLYDIREKNEKIKISKTKMAEQFGVSSLPTTMLINRNGELLGRYGGFGGSPIEDMHQRIINELSMQD